MSPVHRGRLKVSPRWGYASHGDAVESTFILLLSYSNQPVGGKASSPSFAVMRAEPIQYKLNPTERSDNEGGAMIFQPLFALSNGVGHAGKPRDGPGDGAQPVRRDNAAYGYFILSDRLQFAMTGCGNRERDEPGAEHGQ